MTNNTIPEKVDTAPTQGVNRELRSHENNKHDTKLSAQALFNEARKRIIEATEPQFVTYDNVDEDTSSLVTESLCGDWRIERARPRIGYNPVTRSLDIYVLTSISHDSHQPWLVNEIKVLLVAGNILTIGETLLLRVFTGTRYTGFAAPYTAASKEPDVCILPKGEEMPTVVVESGWSESRPKLHQDMQLWLKGGVGRVQVVLLIKWNKSTKGRVSGDIEVYNLDTAGNEVLLQHEQIFPAPTTAASQVIRLTRRQLFGPKLPPGRNPDEMINLSLDGLRQEASEAFAMDGWTPA